MQIQKLKFIVYYSIITTSYMNENKLSLDKLRLIKLKLISKALREFPQSPRQLKTRTEIDKITKQILNYNDDI